MSDLDLVDLVREMREAQEEARALYVFNGQRGIGKKEGHRAAEAAARERMARLEREVDAAIEIALRERYTGRATR